MRGKNKEDTAAPAQKSMVMVMEENSYWKKGSHKKGK
jgi:hypothetical protein